MRAAIAATLLTLAAPPALAQDTAATGAPEMMPAPTPTPAELTAALADPRRDADRARDAWRHPAQTLDFFGVVPGMTVVDFMPAGGWYSRVLIPYLGAKGTYIGLNPTIAGAPGGPMDSYRNAAEKLPAQAREWTDGEGARVIGANTDDDLAPLAGTVDRFLIFREMHNIRRAGWMHSTLMAARMLLGDDGMLGIVQHRAKADAPSAYAMGDNGYLREEDVIAMLESYGFELVDRSEVNANPADPADWERGVWTLPPGYSGTPETDTARRAELDAIGESDRMTLLFRKRA